MGQFIGKTVAARFTNRTSDKLNELALKTGMTRNDLANRLVEYALEHAKLYSTGRTVYRLRFFDVVTIQPSVETARSYFPQLTDRFSGLNGEERMA